MTSLELTAVGLIASQTIAISYIVYLIISNKIPRIIRTSKKK